jgi:V8-like Glu-specific endopeptidase
VAGAADDNVAVSFRGQGGVPHHDPAAEKVPVRSPQQVIGEDGREHVEDTTEYPYSAIAYLDIFVGLDEYQCTGTFIGPDVLVTAAHCLWDKDFGFVGDIIVSPGQDGLAGAPPFGSEFAFDWAVPSEYIQHNGTDSTWDFGIVVMNDGNLGNTVGWLQVGNLQTNTLMRPDFQPAVIGYPFDLGDGGHMWGATQPEFLDVDDFLL